MGQSPETCTLIPVVVPTRITASYLSSHKFNPRGAGHSNQSSLAQWQGSPMTQAAPWRKHRFKYGGRGKQWKTPMNQFSPSVNLSRNLNRRRSTKRCAGFRSAHSCTCFHPLSQWEVAVGVPQPDLLETIWSCDVMWVWIKLEDLCPTQIEMYQQFVDSFYSIEKNTTLP